MKPCRICGQKIKKFLIIGRTPPPEEFRLKRELKDPIITYPHGLAYCKNCGEVQLSYEIPPDIMYKQNYFYDYSLTKTGLQHWTQLAKIIYKKYKLRPSDLVVDIGSNTGALLGIFRKLGVRILGVDPATNLVHIARSRSITTVNNYFTPKVAKQIVKEHGKARVITCNNTFDHVDSLHEFMEGITTLMDKKGIFIIEVPYFKTFVETLNHVVYHQQIDYLLLGPFMKLFNAWGTEIIDCEKIPFHGGSIRIFVAFKGAFSVTSRLKRLLVEEKKLFRQREKVLRRFAQGVLDQRRQLVTLLKKLKRQGKSIGAVGASAKGNILLHYSKIGPEIIDFITEKSTLKVGRYTPSGIPVVADDVLLSRRPDYAVLLAWNFRDELLNNLRSYTQAGGKFIIPIPKPVIIK